MKSMFLHDLKVAYRSLLKYKLQTVISVVGLAVGLSCFVVCNVMFRHYLTWDDNLPNAENIYFLASPDLKNDALFEIGKDIQNKFPEIEKRTVYATVGPYSYKDCVIKDKDGNEKLITETFIYSDSTFFDFFDFELIQGNWDVVKNIPDAFILTESAALRMFGTKDVVGKIFIELKDRTHIEKECKIVALIADFPQGTMLEDIDGLVLNTTDKSFLGYYYLKDRSEMFFRLQADVDLEALNDKIALYLKERSDLLKESLIAPMFYSHLKDGNSYESQLIDFLITSIVGLLVLLTAIFNYVMFMSGRILNRQKEYGIRQITGGSTTSIFRMFTTEISLSIVFSILISLVLMELYYDNQNALLILGGCLLEYALIVWAAMIGICWLILKRFRILTTLQHIQGGGVRYKNRLSNFLLGLQFTICILLSGGAYFLYVQQEFLVECHRGNFSVEEAKRIYSFNMAAWQLRPIRADFQNLVNSNPHIEMASRCEFSLLGPCCQPSDYWKMEGINNDTEDNVANRICYMGVDANYHQLVNAKIEEGRFLRVGEVKTAVVNREFVRRFGINPLGKEIALRFSDTWETFHIVGVMENLMRITDHRLKKLIPCLYIPYNEKNSLTYAIKLLPGVGKEGLEPLIKKMQEQESRFTTFEINSLEENILPYMYDIKRMKSLLFLFASICIVICLLGIYSSMMLAVEKRGREMAIRKINGARLMDIANIFVRHYFVLLGIAALIAFPALYLGVQTFLETYEERIPITPFPFIAIFVLLFAIVLLTIGSQLIKIMRVNPVEKLKSE